MLESRTLRRVRENAEHSCKALPGYVLTEAPDFNGSMCGIVGGNEQQHLLVLFSLYGLSTRTFFSRHDSLLVCTSI
jgi:hypothetical protein